MLQDLKTPFPEAVEEFRRDEKAGPGDGGGVGAPPSSQSEELGVDAGPKRPAWLSCPIWEHIPEGSSSLTQSAVDGLKSSLAQSTVSGATSSPEHSIRSTRSRGPQKRPRDDSDGQEDMAVSLKKKNCRKS